MQGIQQQAMNLISKVEKIVATIKTRVDKRRPSLSIKEYLQCKFSSVIKGLTCKKGVSQLHEMLTMMQTYVDIAFDSKTSFYRGKGLKLMKQHPDKC